MTTVFLQASMDYSHVNASQLSQLDQPLPTFLNQPIKTMVDRFKVRSTNGECQGIINIDDNMKLIIHFTPNGKYIESMAELKIKNSNLCDPHNKIQIIWKCKNKEYPMTLSIKKYIEYGSIGDHKMFRKKYVDQSDYIKITCNIEINDNKNNRNHSHDTQLPPNITISPSSTNKTVTKMKRKRENYDLERPNKRRKLNEYYDRKKKDPSISLSVSYDDINVTGIQWIKSHKLSCKSCKNMKLNYCDRLTPSQVDGEWDNSDWKLNPETLNTWMDYFGKMYQYQNMRPNIDCFATDTNRHAFDYYITKEENFFDGTYECRKFWSQIVAWSNPPFDDDTINNTISAYKRRGMRGYLCVPEWTKKHWHIRAGRLCMKQRRIQTKSRMNAYFPKSTRNKYGRTECKWDTTLFYFDFRGNKL